MSDYDTVLREMAETLGWVRAKLQTIDERLKEHQKQRDKQDARLDALEKWKLKVSAVAGVVSTAVYFIVHYIVKKLGL